MIRILCILCILPFSTIVSAQQSVARRWNEAMLQCIRKDFARPTIHARNIFHISASMYDAWSAYDTSATSFLLGKTVGLYTCPFNGIIQPVDRVAAQKEAVSFAAYRMIRARFQNSPGAAITLPPLDTLMNFFGFDITNTSIDYSSGSPAALGNYIASSYIAYGFTDGANQQGNYANQYYQPVNPPFYANHVGDSNLVNPNRWQQIFLDQYIDQNGNVYTTSPPFLGAEWGNVRPFALSDANKTVYNRNGHDYNVYLDAGAPPQLDTNDFAGMSSDYKTGYLMVSIWQSHLDTADHVMRDISPGAIGNIQSYPNNYSTGTTFYNYYTGGDIGTGRALNPKTGQPYAPNIVRRGDYARVLAEFWADGPNSETPPGHWFTILNYVSDHPEFVQKWGGQGEELSDLDWNIRSYFTLSGALHDAAITAWSNKGWYDSPRPISIIRWMCGKGQCFDPALPNYHAAGTPLIPGYVEMVMPGDPLAGPNNENLYKIKLFTWKGHAYIPDPAVDMAGAGWILAENWWPYQRSSFVTPPFAGFVSGHSTFSRTAAETMTLMTGDNYFPGGMCEFQATQNQYLVFEEGPSENITIQWATYQDASDQCSLSRIYGGIHPPQDDLPGRHMGMFLGPNAFNHADELINAGLPNVMNVSMNYPVISDQQADDFVTFTITYNEDMDPLSQPVISFLDSSAYQSLSNPFVAWEDSRTCTILFLVADQDTTIHNIGIKVTGAKDIAGNEQKFYLIQDLFSIDTQNPHLISDVVSNTLVNSDLQGEATFTILMTYDEPMNISLSPLIALAPANVAQSLVFNQTQSQWVNDTTFSAQFNVIGNVGIPGDIQFAYSFAQDAAGNYQFGSNSENAVFVDTRQPNVAVLSASSYTLLPDDVGPNALSFVAVYSEPMDETVTPVISFPNQVDAQTLLTFDATQSYWLNSQTYYAWFNLTFQSIDIENIPVTIDQAKDIHGNIQIIRTDSNYFAILLDTSSVGIDKIIQSISISKVFPNPVLSGENVNFNVLNSDGVIMMNMYSMSGQLVRSEKMSAISNGLYVLSTQNLSSGIYFIRISDTSKQAVFKLNILE